jgi:hypothetical protein
MGQDVSVNGPRWPNTYRKKYPIYLHLFFFWILHRYVSRTYPTSIGIGYVSRYPIRYGLKYLCFIAPAMRSRCSYALSSTIAASRDAGCCRATSVRRGWPNPVMNNWICCGLVRVGSRQERAMNLLQYSSTEPVRQRSASSPMGLFVNGGPKRALTSWVKRFHVGCPPFNSKRWNHS